MPNISPEGGPTCIVRSNLTALAALAVGTIAGSACADTGGKKIAFSNNYAGNSWRQAMLRIPPIIATLSAFIIQSIDINSYGRGLQIKPPTGFADFTNLQFLGVPVLAILTVLFTVVASTALTRTVYGRSVTANGQNIHAARLAGIPVERIRFLTSALSGTLGGLDGALLAGYFRGANVDLGNEYLLASIAVVVIGGTTVSTRFRFALGEKPSFPPCDD